MGDCGSDGQVKSKALLQHRSDSFPYPMQLILVQSCPMATSGNAKKGLYEVLSPNEEHQEDTIYCSIPK